MTVRIGRIRFHQPQDGAPSTAARPAAPAQPAQPAQPAPVQPDGVPREKPRFRIPAHVATRAGASMVPMTEGRDIFGAARPAPGVVPKGARMAFDNAETAAFFGWAAQGAYANGTFFPGYPYLAELTQRPEYRRPAEILAKEMTRKWIRLLAPGDQEKGEKLKELGQELIRLKARDAFRNAIQLDGFFGRGHIYLDMGAPKGSPERAAPLLVDKAKIKKGGLKSLMVVEPMWTYPNLYNSTDPLARDFYRPTSWFVMGDDVNSTRLLTLIGREVPDMLKPAYSFGGLSLSQMGRPYVDNWLRARQSVSDLLHSFSVSGILTNMAAYQQDGVFNEQGFFDRLALFTNLRDNRGTMLLDKETEEFFNVSTPLSTLDKLQAQAQEHLSSVWGIPLIVLLGITPSGLNASSDGEVRTFYAWVHAQQEDVFRDPLDYVLKIVQLSLWGEIDPDITFDFVPLWQLTEKEQAEMREIEARTDIAYMDAGVMDAEDVRLVLAGSSDPRYAAVDFSGPPPEPPEQQMPAGMGFGEEEGEESGAGKPPFAEDAEFNEADHPRDPDGKFGAGAGGKATPAAKERREKPGVETKMDGKKRTLANGQPLPAHLEALKIPPAWTNVRVNENPDADLLVVGRDAKGRPTAIYSEKFVASQAAQKFARVDALMQQFPTIQAQNAANRASEDPKVKDSADCLGLIMAMGIRPGSETDTGAKVKAYGATTLEGRHVAEEGGEVFLRFVGKKGVSLNLKVPDGATAEMLLRRKNEAGDGGQLFGNIDEGRLLAYTHTMGDGSFKTKDFRTRLGTATADAMVRSRPAPKTEAEYKKAVMEVGKVVSSKLGNTPVIALQSYINPAVFSAWRLPT